MRVFRGALLSLNDKNFTRESNMETITQRRIRKSTFFPILHDGIRPGAPALVQDGEEGL